jgi:H+/Cl- antiporter ClcA
MSVPPPYPPSYDTPPPGPPRLPIPNYLLWAVLATIASLFFCCIIGTIPGIVAIVFAAQVNRKRDEGNELGAMQSSRNAKLWCWITTGLCIVGLLWTVYFVSTGGMARYEQMLQEIEQRHQLQR